VLLVLLLKYLLFHKVLQRAIKGMNKTYMDNLHNTYSTQGCVQIHASLHHSVQIPTGLLMLQFWSQMICGQKCGVELGNL
jgi:hypothetical protein